MKDHPQRIVPVAAPGTLMRRLVTLHAKIKLHTSVERDLTYLAMVRQLPCVRCGMDPCGEAAHVRKGRQPGMGRKPPDSRALPLCRSCHTGDTDSQHRVGEAIFWDRLGINPMPLCARLYAKRGDIVAMRAVILTVIAERG